MSDKMYYRGKDVDEMSREELIDALKIMGKLYTGLLESSKQMNETWSAIARARHS